jgi:1-pyrroline-5-carboxylate dehydrogenase
MLQGILDFPKPVNERECSFAPGSSEREALIQTFAGLKSECEEIPLIIGGKKVETGRMAEVVCPHDHKRVLARYHQAGEKEVAQAIQAAAAAWREWSEMSHRSRLSIFLRAAELISNKYRHHLTATTMLNLSKTPVQSEAEVVSELADFLRFNSHNADQLYRRQPDPAPGLINNMEMRALEGFILAVTPFNFTAIGGNLSTAPAMMGNTVLWKPASSTVFANYQVMKILQEAGLPGGVINFLPGPGAQVGVPAMADPGLAGVHFTGSTQVFQNIWRTIGGNIESYRAYPRIVGETGGKDFLIMHPSADLDATVASLIRGAYECQGQKCSATSRAYLPKSLWPQVKQKLLDEVAAIKMGDIEDFSVFMGAVIDAPAFASIKGYLDYAADSDDYTILCGGGCDDQTGYFVEPTVIQTKDPKSRLMQEEIFGPVLTVYVYPDSEYEETLGLCDQTSPYGLTGAIFARDQKAIDQAWVALRHAAGNFYINDKTTGAMVGRQPFGGGRASGTNDKTGSEFNMLRWVSMRTIKENLAPPGDFRYPYMA